MYVVSWDFVLRAPSSVRSTRKSVDDTIKMCDDIDAMISNVSWHSVILTTVHMLNTVAWHSNAGSRVSRAVFDCPNPDEIGPESRVRALSQGHTGPFTHTVHVRHTGTK